MKNMGEVDFTPSKALFLDSLTKDINPLDCFCEFIDNSIKASIGSKKQYERQIRIYIKTKEDGSSKYDFEIIDNCGGFSKYEAENNIFKLGNERNEGKLGYGIGMKRALFKLTDYFDIKSYTDKESFKIVMDIEKWRNEKKWTIPIDKCDEKSDFYGVSIGGNLKKELKKELLNKKFINQLRDKIYEKYIFIIGENFSIYLGNDKIDSNKLLNKDNLYNKPIINTYGVDINLKIYNLKGSRNLKSGWNFIVNGTCVERIDSCTIKEIFKEEEIKSFDVENFSGYVILKSEDISVLPVNTSKTSIDKSKPIYNRLLNMMKTAMIATKENFIEAEKIITYKKSIVEINEMKRHYRVKFNAEVGRHSFDEVFRNIQSKRLR